MDCQEKISEREGQKYKGSLSRKLEDVKVEMRRKRGEGRIDAHTSEYPSITFILRLSLCFLFLIIFPPVFFLCLSLLGKWPNMFRRCMTSPVTVDHTAALTQTPPWGAESRGGRLPCLCRLQLDWALDGSLFAPLPLTLTQALLGVPGCLPDTQICLILTRQNGSPHFRTTSQMPTKVDQILDPNYPFRLFQNLDEARSCSRNTSLYSALGVISLLGKWGRGK